MRGEPANWEAVELAFIEEVYADPEWSAKRIAAHLERTTAQIYSAAKMLGVQRPKRRLDYDRIAELKAKGLGDEAIAMQLQCSKGGVQGALRVLSGSAKKRLSRIAIERTNKPWSGEELAFLAEVYPKPEWFVLRIAKELRRSEASIYRKAHDLGLKKGEAA
ncbi:hypothetical protein [Halomonas sp. 707B3]|uniref:hypothetical protein n=1 Tax=Halomonas sp. 707B3 TaxID=1681043 RepID=UPI00209D0472|nr:hypothetical protein [Halomonas sp. 707B3]MCP1316391.1 hypothetical protein [Halomonas sp. 707B3]